MAPRSVLRSGPDGADRVDGAGRAVAVGAPAGAVAAQVAAAALQVDEVAPAGVAADPAVDVAAHVAPAVDAAAAPALRVLRAGGVVAGGAAHGGEPGGVAQVDVPVRAVAGFFLQGWMATRRPRVLATRLPVVAASPPGVAVASLFLLQPARAYEPLRSSAPQPDFP